ncbi:MAG: prepilin-type N-terminal cleavage/methylation domain-containing protein [Candidatus Hydrogenedentes bacterium]|nr:prepilin-type N-terminal cleavage/methylation domain-containing protein [Candidatus Hydrogenedentota bacterium]
MGMNNRGFTLLEVMTASAILSVLLLTLYGLSEAFAGTAQVQRAKIQGNEEARRGVQVVLPLVRMASRSTVNWNQLPGPVLTFRAAEDVDGNGTAVNVGARLELGAAITVGPDLQDANEDGVTATQLVMVQGDVVTVLANHLVAPPGGAQPTADNSGFWVTPRDAGVELMIRAQGRTARGRVMTTSMSQFAAMRN